MNVKTVEKGKHKRIQYADPFRSEKFKYDYRINAINQFINWLEKWESTECNSNGKLTWETSHSLILTFRSLLSFLDTMFNNPVEFGLDPGKKYYFLTGKLQTDILEKRFGTYRQLNGAAYLMTFKEVIAAEKKIRIRTKIKMGNFKFRIKIEDEKGSTAIKEKGDLFIDIDHILEDSDNISEMVERSQSKELGAILYISGAIAYKLKLKLDCQTCFSILIDSDNSYEVEDNQESDYFDDINRGGLQNPSVFLFSLVKICLNFFDLYVRPALGTTIKNPSSCQLREIFYEYLCKLSYFEEIIQCEGCKFERDYLFKAILRILSNICLNNFCKIETNKAREEVLKKSSKNSNKSIIDSAHKTLKNQKQINITGNKQ